MCVFASCVQLQLSFLKKIGNPVPLLISCYKKRKVESLTSSGYIGQVPSLDQASLIIELINPAKKTTIVGH